MTVMDACGRIIPDWRGKEVFHTTDEEGAEDIAKGGYRVLTEDAGGYYGFAISFTDDLTYSRNFGRVTTVAVLSKRIRILNVTTEKGCEAFARITNYGKIRGDQYGPLILAAGYDGIYDPGAGDLFIYNAKKVKYLRTAIWDGRRETRELLAA